MVEYTTERGITINVMPIPLLLDKIRAAHPEVEPATYTEHVAGGATQQVIITEQMAATWQAEDPATWAQYAEAWAEYQARDGERTKRLNDALWKAVMRKAIIASIPPDDEWADFQRELGIDIPPRGSYDHREHYIWTEVIGGTRDILRIMGLASGADLTEEQIASAEASFWNTLERPTAGQPTAQTGAVDAGNAGRADTDGKGVGAEAVKRRPVRSR